MGRCRAAAGGALLAPLALLAGCSAGGPGITQSAVSTPSTPIAPSPSAAPSRAVATSTAATARPPTAAPASSPALVTPTGTGGATPAPAWLGTRVLRTGVDGLGIAGATPPELVDRRIVTTDLLPPPADGRFHARVSAVPAVVLDRSSWSIGCPVPASDLRYLTVGFRGFDGRAHTGELLVNADAAAALVGVFRRLFAAGFPIEQMRIASQADLDAPSTGDGNVTGSFACRPVRGATLWSQHAYGRAVDLDPFQNPEVMGRSVLPELARAYTDRGRRRPGMILPGGVVVRAFESVGWGWGGNFRSKRDWMHFSATGG